MTKELNNFTHCSKLDLIKIYKKSRRDVRRLSRQKVELEQQLAQAKELIEDMYDKIPSSHSDYYKDVMERARQFLKDVPEIEKMGT